MTTHTDDIRNVSYINVSDNNGTCQLCSITQHTNTFLNEKYKRYVYNNFEDIRKLHEERDIIFDDGLIEDLEVKKEHREFFRWLLGDEVDLDVWDGKCYEYVCESGRKVYYKKYEVGKNHAYRKERSVESSVNRLLRYITVLWNKYDKMKGVSITFTVPKELSELYVGFGNYKNGIRIINRAVKKFMRKFKKEVCRKKGWKMGNVLLGYVDNTHLWSTENPGEPHLHVHLLLFNLVYLKDVEKFAYIPYWYDVGELRAMWKESLRDVGVSIDGDVDIHMGYKKEIGRVRHYLKYSGRKWVMDAWDKIEKIEMDEVKKDWYKKLYYYENRRRAYGWMNKISVFVKPVKADKVCPICGKKLKKNWIVDYLEGYEEGIYWEDELMERGVAKVKWSKSKRKWEVIVKDV